MRIPTVTASLLRSTSSKATTSSNLLRSSVAPLSSSSKLSPLTQSNAARRASLLMVGGKGVVSSKRYASSESTNGEIQVSFLKTKRKERKKDILLGVVDKFIKD